MNAAIKNHHQLMDYVNQLTPPTTVTEKPVVLGYKATVISVSSYETGIRCDLTFNGTEQTTATMAEGILVSPEVGDIVLCVEVDQEFIVTQILKKAQPSPTLVLHSNRPIEWIAPIFRFKALKEMELLSARKLTVNACDLVLGAGQTMVQQARNLLQNANNFSLTAKGLMRLNAKQQVIIAEEDIRMDGKRINMG